MSATPNNCFHLTVEIVREIHDEAIVRFGGLDGVLERALLESAVAAPQATFGLRIREQGLTQRRRGTRRNAEKNYSLPCYSRSCSQAGRNSRAGNLTAETRRAQRKMLGKVFFSALFASLRLNGPLERN